MLYTHAPAWVQARQNEAIPMTEDKTTLPPPKKRYEWIDNARIVAALLIIYAHMGLFFPNEPHVNNDIAYDIIHSTTYWGRVPFFLILAGYFLGRNITWRKACDRALWLLIPFFIWNVLYYLFILADQNLTFHSGDLLKILGLGAVFSPKITICGLDPCIPSIGVSWFLRDIIVLSLLTPILVRLRLFVVVMLIAAIAYLPFNTEPQINALLAPHTCFYYLLGTCLSNCRIDDAYRILNKGFTPIVLLGFLLALFFSLFQTLRDHHPMGISLLGGVFGALMIAQCGVLVENHLPKFSKWLAPCGPACFLVFMLHAPLFYVLPRVLPSWYTGSIFIWLIPIPACALIIAFFLLMKKYTPWLMPYLGHMKVPKKQPVDAPAAKVS